MHMWRQMVMRKCGKPNPLKRLRSHTTILTPNQPSRPAHIPPQPWTPLSPIPLNAEVSYCVVAPTTDLGLPATPSTREERFAALGELLSMYGMLHDLYERADGAEEWHRQEQAA